MIKNKKLNLCNGEVTETLCKDPFYGCNSTTAIINSNLMSWMVDDTFGSLDDISDKAQKNMYLCTF